MKILTKISKFCTMAKKHDIIWLESVDSTNNEAKREFNDIDNLSVLSAVCQSEGRGQRGNSWSSDAGMNLVFSIILKFDDGQIEPIKAYDQFIISKIAALTVTDFLASYGIDSRIKWPNDIYEGNRKICGILIENASQGQDITRSIIGIGLNVNQIEFDSSLPNPVSMRQITGRAYNLHEILDEFMDIFKDYLRRYNNIRCGYGRLRSLYLSQLYQKDVKATYVDCTETEHKTFRGIIRGVSDTGQLIIENEEGELKEFAFKEISYVI